MNKELGKISNCYFGYGGYNEACIGIHFTFEGIGWGTSWNHSVFAPSIIEWTDSCKWTEEERNKLFAEMVRYIDELLSKAKVNSVDRLKGIPVEITFEDNTLKSFRILEEVL